MLLLLLLLLMMMMMMMGMGMRIGTMLRRMLLKACQVSAANSMHCCELLLLLLLLLLLVPAVSLQLWSVHK